MATLKSCWHPEPVYHLKAPQGWLNDPCAPGYDAATGVYHLFYQWNPTSCDWGDICWGHYTSKDGLHWTHNGSEPVLKPDSLFDKEGVFTGCLFPKGPRGEGDRLSIIYSSVSHLPIHWSKPYFRNSAGLSIAVSSDKGHTWDKLEANPILAGEPEGLVVTGFRDPYLAEWPALDEIRGQKSLYGLVSGGIVGQGPTTFLYAIPHEDLAEWHYLGPLVDFPVRHRPSNKWAGDFGVNWECANFMTLRDGFDQQEFILMGSEGGLRKDVHSGESDDPYAGYCMWMGGTLVREGKGASMKYDFSGLLDNGCFYAANSYEHPVNKTRILWGWLKEEDLTLPRRERKGWTGYLSLPRELFYVTIPRVTRALQSSLYDISSIKVSEPAADGTHSIHTLGIRPDQNLHRLRRQPPREWHNITEYTLLAQSTNWELQSTINVQRGLKRVGFYVGHSSDVSQRTEIYFSVEDEEIVVDRSRSNSENDIKKDSMSGPFTLFSSLDEKEVESIERLHLHIYGDGDTLEIFANDRFALSTMVYADFSTSNGISCFVQYEDYYEGASAFEDIHLWENLDSVLGDAQRKL